MKGETNEKLKRIKAVKLERIAKEERVEKRRGGKRKNEKERTIKK